MAREFPTLRVVAWWELVKAGILLVFTFFIHQTSGQLNTGEAVVAILQGFVICNATQAVAAILALLLPSHRRRRAAAFVMHVATAIIHCFCGSPEAIALLLVDAGPLNVMAATFVVCHVSAATVFSLFCGVVLLLQRGGWPRLVTAVKPGALGHHSGLKLWSAAQGIAAGMALLRRGHHQRRTAAFVALATDAVTQCLVGRFAFMVLVSNDGLVNLLAAAVIYWHVCGALILALFCCVLLWHRG